MKARIVFDGNSGSPRRWVLAREVKAQLLERLRVEPDHATRRNLAHVPENLFRLRLARECEPADIQSVAFESYLRQYIYLLFIGNPGTFRNHDKEALFRLC